MVKTTRNVEWSESSMRSSPSVEARASDSGGLQPRRATSYGASHGSATNPFRALDRAPLLGDTFAMAAAAGIQINRAPVLTLWAAVVAERLGYDREEALTLGRAVAGLNAQSKGRRLGINQPAEPGRGKAKAKAAPARVVELLHRAVPVTRTTGGLRALDSDGSPADPESVERYLESKFGESLDGAREAMEALAASLTPNALAERAFALYESFRPAIPGGTAGWGAKGTLDLAKIRSLAGR